MADESAVLCKLATKTGEVVEFTHPTEENNQGSNKTLLYSLKELQSQLNNYLTQLIEKEKMEDKPYHVKSNVNGRTQNHGDDDDYNEDSDDDDGDDGEEDKSSDGQNCHVEPPKKQPRV